MRLNAPTAINNVNSLDDLKRFTGIFASQVSDILNANLTFADNFAAKLITFTFTAANQTVGVNHGLGVIPSGYILAGSDKAVSLFDGGQKNTSSTLYLQASGAAVARVLVFV